MATLEFALKILAHEDMKHGDRPIEFGMAIIGTSKEQRELSVKLLRLAAPCLELLQHLCVFGLFEPGQLAANIIQRSHHAVPVLKLSLQFPDASANRKECSLLLIPAGSPFGEVDRLVNDF